MLLTLPIIQSHSKRDHEFAEQAYQKNRFLLDLFIACFNGYMHDMESNGIC